MADTASSPTPASPTPKKQLETYKKVKVLGKGSFGKAFLVTCGSDGGSWSKFITKLNLGIFYILT